MLQIPDLWHELVTNCGSVFSGCYNRGTNEIYVKAIKEMYRITDQFLKDVKVPQFERTILSRHYVNT